MNAIEFENVSYTYNGEKEPTVKNLNFAIEKGEFVAVIGHNGGGKSTLAKLINGLLIPSFGTVKIFGNDTKDKDKVFEIRKNAGMVFQNPDNQTVATIVEDDVAFGAENIGLDREEIGKRIDFALDAVNMKDFRFSTPTRLSGGQKQRLAIAGVLAIKPQIIIFDESTAMLDPSGRKEVMAVARKLNKENGMTVVFITHYMDEVVESDKVMIIGNGEIALTGTPEEIFSRTEILEKTGLALPLCARIAEKLSESSFETKKEILTGKELSDELCEYLQKI